MGGVSVEEELVIFEVEGLDRLLEKVEVRSKVLYLIT